MVLKSMSILKTIHSIRRETNRKYNYHYDEVLRQPQIVEKPVPKTAKIIWSYNASELNEGTFGMCEIALFFYLSINFAFPSEYLSPAGLILEEAVSIS